MLANEIYKSRFIVLTRAGHIATAQRAVLRYRAIIFCFVWASSFPHKWPEGQFSNFTKLLQLISYSFSSLNHTYTIHY